MACRTRTLLALSTGLVLAVPALGAQEMPNPDLMQAQAQHVARERPREAEAAARAFLQLVAPDRVPGLDSLKARALDRYWMEVGQLTVQFELVQNLHRRDSVRAGIVARMFGLEANARARQRAYRDAPEPVRATLRSQIETLIAHHFDLENQLRALEIADIERRLAEVRAETQRRIEKRMDFVRWTVDDIIRDALRPQ